ncbi:putative transporter svop-1 isoform X2 [Drosophila novamexicana]|uniref:putative transporter svop-1 isoform X2 n=1 Tax=Drosophila novamexicana TaxID=47314 RepID=UPI0011E5B25D|nr:putative transporter svop-1 isoform X2 [Drosophila novamexicana]
MRLHFLTGFGWMQALMVFTCSLTCVFLNDEIMGVGLVAVDIACEFSLSNKQLSLLSIAAFVGLILTSHYSGYLTDKIGRRKIMLYSMVLAMVSSIISILMPSFYYFLFWRFMTGLLISGVSVNNITYISEFTKVKLQSVVVNIMCFAFAFGAIYVPVVAHFLSPLNRILFSWGNFHLRAWRLNMLLNSTPGFLAIILMWMLPETAKFLISVGKMDRAYETLNRLCLKNRGKDLASLGITGVFQADLPESTDKRKFCESLWYDTVPLLKPPYLKNFLICTVILSGYFFVGNGITLWFMKLRQNMSDSNMIICDMIKYTKTSHSTSICPHKTSNFIDGIVLGCAFLGCCILISLLLICVRNSYIQFSYTIIATICGFSLNFLKLQVPILIVMVLFSSLLASSIPLISSVLCAVVPTHLRGMAINMSYMFARLSVVIASALIGNWMVPYCLVTFNIFVVFALVVTFFTFLLPKI